MAQALQFALGAAVAAGAAELPDQRTVEVFGQKIAFYEAGSGPTVVLLHGLATNAAVDWGTCIGPIAARHHVIAPDQLGFGSSDKPLVDYGIQTWVDTLGEFIRVKRVSDFTLVGESLGGWIAAQYAIQAAGPAPPAGPSFALVPPRKLILVDAAGHRHLAEQMSSGGGASASLAGSKFLLSAIFFEPARSSEAEVRMKFAQILGKGDGWTIRSVMSNKGIVAESVDDKLASIAIPTLVVWGGEDRLVPLDDGRDFARKIAGARLVVIPKSGHAPAVERADEFLAAALPFIDQP
ncbi:MAG TPA: alpha/beta hydrolase [Opitutaceae bacterium]|nr:alpha/beta hydrolase [Opitutaceae bacterium]